MTITGRPCDIGGLPGVYNTNMWFWARKSGLRVVNIGFRVRKTGDGGIKLVDETITGLQPFYDLPGDETEVPVKNECKPMQNEGSGAETRSPRPRKTDC